MDWPFPMEEVQLFLSPSGLMVVAPFSPGNYRIVATLDRAPEHVTREDLQTVVNERGPQRTVAMIHELKWSSRFHIHHGVAACYRSRHAFLIGDAGHVHSPAGGQGMNIGIQDACDLGDRFASVLQGREDDSLLDKYEATRRPIAERVVSLTDRLTRIATVKGSVRQELRNFALEVLDHLPRVQQKLAMQLAELRD
jgi:2-polyprenyl-6-methoxyphenol hydroxylase-like FAD-dependent oxidoreductase